MLRQLTMIGCLIILTFSGTVMANNQYQDALSGWARTLERFVDEQGSIDFKALADEPQDLRNFVDFIASTSPASHPELFVTKEDVIAYHINAYNALAMYGVIERGIPDDFSSFFKRLSFFKLRKITIGNQKTSLYDYENKVIRPLDEPRTHFALNCMVRDCPRLPRQPFIVETLEQQLESVTREFFSKEKHFRLDNDKRVAYLSAILDFYTKDFVRSGKESELGLYVNNYLETPIPENYKIRFIKYNWTINQQPDR